MPRKRREGIRHLDGDWSNNSLENLRVEIAALGEWRQRLTAKPRKERWIKPCPFCGSPGKLGAMKTQGEWRALVSCSHCSVDGPGSFSRLKDCAKVGAVQLWNTRPAQRCDCACGCKASTVHGTCNLCKDGQHAP